MYTPTALTPAHREPRARRRIRGVVAGIAAATTVGAALAVVTPAQAHAATTAYVCTVKAEIGSGADDLRDNSRISISIQKRWGDVTYGNYFLLRLNGSTSLPGGIPAWSTAQTAPMDLALENGGSWCVAPDLLGDVVVRFDGNHGGAFQTHDNWDMRVFDLIPDKVVGGPGPGTATAPYSLVGRSRTAVCPGVADARLGVRFTADRPAWRLDVRQGCWRPV